MRKNHNILRPKPLLALAGALLVLLLGLPWLALAQGPVGPTFTYQGRLVKAGAYLDGAACDFRFTMWDAPQAGSQVGTVQAVSAFLVDGYFTVTLNQGGEFGPDAFNGSRRYLVVEVRCPGDAAFVALNSQRVELAAAPYALYALDSVAISDVPWTGVTGKPAGFADDVDNFNTYTSGYGLRLTGNEFSVVTETIIAAIPPAYQDRVGGACLGAQAIRAIRSDGAVSCDSDTGVQLVAGQGLNLNGLVFSIDDAYLQRRITTVCPDNQAMRVIEQTGQAVCVDIPQGDITEVVAGAGLTGGGESGDVTVGVATGGITTTMLANRAVTADKIPANAVNAAKIAPNAVNDTAKIVDNTITAAKFGQGSCTAASQVMKWNNAASAWVCLDDNITTYTGGDGISVNNGLISARVATPPKGVQIDTAVSPRPLAMAYLGADPPTGSAGSSARPARSDHLHEERYPRFTDSPGGDITGSYNAGFTVAGLEGVPIGAGTPAAGYIWKYVTVPSNQWQAQSYNFNLNICARTQSGTGTAEASCAQLCGTSYTLLTGGCWFSSDDGRAYYSMPSTTGASTPNTRWRCRSHDPNRTINADLVCIGPTAQ